MRDRLRQRPGGKRGPLTGPNPTDRGKPGSKIHLITDRSGVPLSLGISGANMHDSLGLEPLVRGIPPIRWVVERTVSWLAGCRRLHRRYERKAEHFLAFVGIAAALISYRRLTN
jgi:transposase